MNEIEVKLRIFEAIAQNCQNMLDSHEYYSPLGIAKETNRVYEVLNDNNE